MPIGQAAKKSGLAVGLAFLGYLVPIIVKGYLLGDLSNVYSALAFLANAFIYSGSTPLLAYLLVAFGGLLGIPRSYLRNCWGS